ncbi:endo alpha-1,4 polygalactosaminidase [Sphaerisporangium fuscum]|uniref:endo alpha-1,4 polygalactosaminidase n=1 Tax=Sphaerisporangium fuscum TaxID=2835868 RepID=UPI001BDD1E1F|nr:endo alpha-1,4 polygalactosaminidase [Sphaerisporangium fuscum]
MRLSRLTSIIALTVLSLTAVQAQAQAAALPDPVACSGCWKPALQTSWQWQLKSVPSAPFLDVQMYDIDGFNTGSALVKSLHDTKAGRKVVCYISAGSYENWRPDAAQFPASVLGKNLDGWEGERWLDIRQYGGTLGTIMKSRLDMCKAKGFDAVEPDNVDGYTNKTGFPLKAEDQLAYNTWLANEAHKRGLSVALKNDNAQIPKLLPYFDFALNEQCFEFSECTTADNGDYGYDQFVKAGKAVFEVEYNLSTSKFCSKANSLNFNSLKKKLELDATPRTPCRGT